MSRMAENDNTWIGLDLRALGEEKAADIILEMQSALGQDIVPAIEGMIDVFAATLAVQTSPERAATKMIMVAHAIIRADEKRRAMLN